MTFSQHYEIEISNTDDWFDPILFTDTKLFIDPLLISQRVHPKFREADTEINKFFFEAFKIAAQCQRVKSDLKYRTLAKMLIFPEVNELNLGYSKSLRGAGAGKGFAKDIMDGIFNSIDLGITDLNRFENIGLFSEGIGRDRISDISANILKEYFINYTQEVCRKHGIKMIEFPIFNYKFNYQTLRWDYELVELPENPYKNEGIILTPKKFINDFPFISKNRFVDFIWERKNEDLRDEFSIQIKSSFNVKNIIEIAKVNIKWISEFNDWLNKSTLNGYDLDKDKRGLYSTLKDSFPYLKSNPRDFSASDLITFNSFVEEIINVYADFIENNSGYKLLWNDDGKSKNEEAVQLTFVGIVKHYCISNNIDLSKEVNLGRGPVDFKFSSGYKNRASIEIKLAKNSKFWNGIRLQLPKYLEVEDIKKGHFVVICYTEKELKSMNKLSEEAKKISKEIGREIIPYVIDATKEKPSASKLT